MDNVALFNKGIYTLPRAARLLGLPGPTLYSWVGAGARNPVADRDIPTIDNTQAISFAALIELLMIKRIRDCGFTLQCLRKILDTLRKMHGVNHPFALNLTIYTEGKSKVFLQEEREVGGPTLLELVSKNYTMKGVIKQSLSHGITFRSSDKHAKSWQPSDEQKSIILRPDIAFGEPIIRKTGIRSHVLFNTFLAEEKTGLSTDRAVERIANWYEIKPEQVWDAVSFERALAA